jgi:hypothetical protein
MTRGGHHYPIEHVEGRELDFANLLWEALLSDRSPRGAQFSSELDNVYLRSLSGRLVRLLNAQASPQLPSMKFEETVTFKIDGDHTPMGKLTKKVYEDDKD